MTTATINTKIDLDTKQEAQALAKEMGISLSMLINASLKNFVRTKEFSVSLLPPIRNEFADFLMAVDGEVRDEKNLMRFKNNKDALAFLDTL